MTNILEAISNLTNIENFDFKEIVIGNNRAISMGAGLEEFVKNSFANTLDDNIDSNTKKDIHHKLFSFGGSKNKTPDLMIRNGEAFEIKKTESLSTEIQLNSSYPKNKLFATSPLVDSHCIKCEDWNERDFSYIFGYTPKGKNYISSLWFIDGEVYAADEDNYLTLKNRLSNILEESNQFNLEITKEIGKINGVDPLGITSLRIRGMWLIKHPFKVFSEFHGYDSKNKFQVISILSTRKYNSYPKSSIDKIESNCKVKITDIKVVNPNNTVSLIDSKLIKYTLEN
jgi:hypothetical protein